MTVHFIVCWIVLRCTILDLHYCSVMYCTLYNFVLYIAVSALHYCSVMYCTPLYNICFITVLTLHFVVYSTVLCTVLSVHFVVLYSAVHFSGFKPDILYTLSVRLCTLCMVAVHSNLCCVCTLCIPVEREGSLLARIG